MRIFSWSPPERRSGGQGAHKVPCTGCCLQRGFVTEPNVAFSRGFYSIPAHVGCSCPLLLCLSVVKFSLWHTLVVAAQSQGCSRVPHGSSLPGVTTFRRKGKPQRFFSAASPAGRYQAKAPDKTCWDLLKSLTNPETSPGVEASPTSPCPCRHPSGDHPKLPDICCQ